MTMIVIPRLKSIFADALEKFYAKQVADAAKGRTDAYDALTRSTTPDAALAALSAIIRDRPL